MVAAVDGASFSAEGSPSRQIARALRLISEHPDRHWTVPKMAAAVSLSRSAFAERFRAVTGDTPTQNLTRFRMARAAE